MSTRKQRNKTKNRPAARQADSVAPEDKQTQMTVSATEVWAGPIPPPEALQKYEDIVPGAANRILKMAEGQTAHRIQIEKTVVRGDSWRSFLGLIFGFIVSMTGLLGGIYIIDNGHDWAGGVLVGLDLVGLAGCFVYGSRSRRVEREQNAEEMSVR